MSDPVDRIAALEKQLKEAQASNNSLTAQLTGRETIEAETKERIEAAKDIQKEVQALQDKAEKAGVPLGIFTPQAVETRTPTSMLSSVGQRPQGNKGGTPATSSAGLSGKSASSGGV